MGYTGVVYISGIIAKVKNFKYAADRELVKDYVHGSTDPDTLEAGNATYTFSIDQLWISTDTMLTKVLAGTKNTIEMRPQGTGGGLKKVTLGNALIKHYELTSPQTPLTVINVTGEALTMVEGSQS